MPIADTRFDPFPPQSNDWSEMEGVSHTLEDAEARRSFEEEGAEMYRKHRHTKAKKQ